MTKILITGATGMLGMYVCKILSRYQFELFCPTRKELDLQDSLDIKKIVETFCPNFILHLAAETNVDLCEIDIKRAAIVNYVATATIAESANKVGALLIYISSSIIFGRNDKMMCNELDTPYPINYYGYS
jgi:dTDP-4-dehydrorhamnose reductase